MKKIVIAWMFLLSLGLVACGNKTAMLQLHQMRAMVV